ncbi:tetratricopeptide repeat protein [Methanosarcina hadiensis]|uniref:tetratricopeptide repeat protein n=1 Tax=Methanosarcina hadiensis TaxID=3078083 RepID=UPI003977B95D
MPEHDLRVKLFGDHKLKISDIFDEKRGIYYVPVLAVDGDMNKLNQLGFTGKNVKCAVLDSGVLPEHPYLKYRVEAIKDFTGSGYLDKNGHGTAVALNLAMTAPDAPLLIGKVYENDDAPLSEYFYRIARGVNWAVDSGAKIINLSVGIEKRKEDLCKNPELLEAVVSVCRAIRRAIENRVSVFAAAGANFPADCHETIIVVGLIDIPVYPKDIPPAVYIPSSPILVPAFLYEGYVNLSKGMYNEALASFNEAVDICSEDPQFWKYRAICFYNLNEYENAAQSLNEALAIEQSDVEAWYLKGVTLRAIFQYDNAIECFDKVLEIIDYSILTGMKLADFPKSVTDDWYNMGVYYEQAKRYDNAAKCYENAIHIDPLNAQAWNNSGVISGIKGRYEDSIKYFTRAMETDPLMADAWFNKGLALSMLGRYEESIEFFDKATEIDSTFSKALNQKIRVLRKLNRENE